MIRQSILFFFLFFSFVSFAGRKGSANELPADFRSSFLTAQADEFDDEDLEGIEGGEEEEPPPEEDDEENEGDDIPPLEDRGDYEVIDPELEEDLENRDDEDEGEGNGDRDEDGDGDDEGEGDDENGGEAEDDSVFEDELNKEEYPDENEDLGAEGMETEPVPDEGETEPVPDEVETEPFDLMADNEDEGGDLNLITNIRYISGEDMIVIDGTKTVFYKAKRNTANNQLVIEILQARMMDNLEWPYVLKDFNTNFGMIQADQKNEDTVRILIEIKDNKSFPSTKISEKGNQILVGFGGLPDGDVFAGESKKGSGRMFKDDLPAKTIEDFLFSENLKFTGSPISFHVINAPVEQVLQFVSEESGLNMVMGRDVKGKMISLKLENVPWDQAFHIVVSESGLGYRRQGNVIIVNTLEFMQKRSETARKIAESKTPLDPVKTEVISISYADLSDIENKVKDFLTKENEIRKQKAGRIIIDDKTSTFIVMDTEKVIEKIKKIIKRLDRPPRQVMVEARIVEATETLSRSFGLSWSLTGNFPANLSPDGFLDFFRGNFFGDYDVNTTGQGMDMTLNVSQVPIIGDISAALNLAETEGYGRVVSSPKVVSISGESAKISRDAVWVFLTSSPQIINQQGPAEGDGEGGGGGQQAQSQEYGSLSTQTVALTLDVTPRITAGGSVFLDVNITRETPSAAGSIQSGSPLKTSRSASTKVLVQNGHTIVIGGIYQYDQTSAKDGVPFFSKVPFLSWLFDKITSSYSKDELLVFLTPKILDANE